MPMAPIIMDIAQCVSSIMALVLSLIAFFISFRTRRVQQYDGIVNAFERMNSLALANDNNLEILYRLHYPDRPSVNATEMRKHWLCYPILNALELTFYANRKGAIHKATAHRILSRAPRIANDPDIQKILEEGTYTADFTDFMNKNNNKQDPGKSGCK